MKSLASRAFILIALVALTHYIKPFTSNNLIAFAHASMHSLTELLPESAVRKASVLAAVVSSTWQQGKTVVPAPSNFLAMQPATTPALARYAKRRLKAAPRQVFRVNDEAENENDENAFRGNPVISLQAAEPDEESATEKAEQPSSFVAPPPAVLPAWSITPKQRDACEIPDPDDTSDSAIPSAPEAAPSSEREPILRTQPSPGVRPIRPLEPELIEWQLIVSPRSAAPAIRLRYLPSSIKAAQKNGAKC